MRRALEDPVYDADVNVVGTINVLEAARRVGARVVFTSTGGAGYGEYEGLQVPSPETSETRPLSHYGMSKMAGEGYCNLYARLYGSEVSILRLGNVYGPRQDPHGEAGVVAIFCGKMLDGETPKVFGDGMQTRDYVYVGDVVGAFLAAEAGTPGETVNVGAGVEVTVLDLLAGLGYEGEPEFAPARPGELQRSALDVSKAERVYGWKAETPLGEGLGITYRSVIAARRDAGRPPARGLLADVILGGRTGSPARIAAGPSSTIQERACGWTPIAAAAASSPVWRSGGRHGPAEWASEAMKCAAPPPRSATAVRFAAGPWSPRNEPAGDLHQRPAADERRAGGRGPAARPRRARGGRGPRRSRGSRGRGGAGAAAAASPGRASPAAASVRRPPRLAIARSSRSGGRATSSDISPPVWISSGTSASASAVRSFATPSWTLAGRSGSSGACAACRPSRRVPDSQAARAISTESPTVAGPSSMPGRRWLWMSITAA